MATRRDFTLSTGRLELKCSLNEEQIVVITIDDCAGDDVSIKIDSRDDLEQLIKELNSLRNRMKAL